VTVEVSKYRKRFFACLLAIVCASRLPATDDVYFSKIGIEQGLSQFSVMSIYQDEWGAIWLGTREGVNRYNGTAMEVLLPAPGTPNTLSGNLIQKICGDGRGHVYIQTQNGVDAYNLQLSTCSPLQLNPVETIAYGQQCLWFAKGNKLYTRQAVDGQSSLFLDVKESHSPITVVLPASNGQVYAGTLSSGVFLIDRNRQVRRLIAPCSRISVIFEDSRGNIWIGSWHDGLFRTDRNGGVVSYRADAKKPNAISSDFVRTICEDNNGALWIGTEKGLDKLTPENGVAGHYNSDEDDARHLSNKSVWSLLKDRQGTIWVGTYFGGVNFFNPHTNIFSYHDLRRGGFRNKPFPIISRIVEDKAGNLFLCTEGDGLIYYNPQTGNYRHFNPDGLPGSLPNYNIKTAWYDARHDELWMGLHLGGLCKLDIRRFRFTLYRNVMPEREQSNVVRAIVPRNGRLLVATFNGVYVFDRNTGAFSLFSALLNDKVSYCTDMKVDSAGNLWIASRGLFHYCPETNEVRSWFFNPEDPASLSNNDVQKIFIDSGNRVWVATNGGGVCLFDGKSNSFVRYNSRTAGLENDFVSNLMQSPAGHLMITTTQGFSVLDVDRRQVHNYGIKNGFPLNSMFNGGMCLTRKGQIVMAGMNGLISFEEKNLPASNRPAALYLVNLRVNNRPVRPNDESGVLKTTLAYTSQIVLNHTQHSLSIGVASDNYVATNRPACYYRLEHGSDAAPWTELPKGAGDLNFMNLTPGDYLLTVEGRSPNNGETVAATRLAITIRPPFYKTWWAYLAWALLAAGAIGRYMAFSRSRLLLTATLEYEKKEKAHLEAVNQSKLEFFTNISHEFRTPLTLINGQVDMLLQSNLHTAAHRRVLSIRANVQNLKSLITELLEFRRIEQGHLKIKACEMDIVAFVHEIYRSFATCADRKQIAFGFACEAERIALCFDPVQLQKVFYNLLSNAVKYTPEGGNIAVEIRDLPEAAEIDIVDTGIGIHAGEADRIFDCFYQAENGAAINTGTPGAGIGLALAKSILKAHHAAVQVKSAPGNGSTFTVRMPKGSDHFDAGQLAEPLDVDRLCIARIEELREKETEPDSELPSDNRRPTGCTMLIVEDHDELRRLLKQAFDPLYTVYVAADGEEGLAMTIERRPDIVLSDVMMPRLSGFELCAKIKSNFELCHTPVILLTARASIEANVEGWQAGADDYVTKPFELTTLIVRCHNIINGRKILREKFGRQVDTSSQLMATNRIDSEFLEKAQAIIERNINNPAFDVQFLSREMALGRTKLFAKIKSIAGQTPNDFILTIRLKRAAMLLAERPEYNVSDVCYDTGFSAPKYFTKCFREHFGISPSGFRKKMVAQQSQEATEKTSGEL
jgi:signal transduction histidine kinase/ligand-binding sensor domain-containing protein/DNA-binding response OmpR family regulator